MAKSMPGSVFNLRASARKLVRLAKEKDVRVDIILDVIRWELARDVERVEKAYWGEEVK